MIIYHSNVVIVHELDSVLASVAEARALDGHQGATGSGAACGRERFKSVLRQHTHTQKKKLLIRLLWFDWHVVSLFFVESFFVLVCYWDVC